MIRVRRAFQPSSNQRPPKACAIASFICGLAAMVTVSVRRSVPSSPAPAQPLTTSSTPVVSSARRLRPPLRARVYHASGPPGQTWIFSPVPARIRASASSKCSSGSVSVTSASVSTAPLPTSSSARP